MREPLPLNDTKTTGGGCDPAVDDMQKVSLNILLSDTFLCKQI